MLGRAWPPGMRVSVQGFVDNMEQWMAACDIIITKAGPGTIVESLIMGLPILLNGFVPCQEAGNVPFVINNGVGCTLVGARVACAKLWTTCALQASAADQLGGPRLQSCLPAARLASSPEPYRTAGAAAPWKPQVMSGVEGWAPCQHEAPACGGCSRARAVQVGAYEKDPDALARVLQRWMRNADGELAGMKQRAAALGQRFAGGLFRIVSDLAGLADQAGAAAAPAFRKYIPPDAFLEAAEHAPTYAVHASAS